MFTLSEAYQTFQNSSTSLACPLRLLFIEDSERKTERRREMTLDYDTHLLQNTV